MVAYEVEIYPENFVFQLFIVCGYSAVIFRIFLTSSLLIAFSIVFFVCTQNATVK